MHLIQANRFQNRKAYRSVQGENSRHVVEARDLKPCALFESAETSKTHRWEDAKEHFRPADVLAGKNYGQFYIPVRFPISVRNIEIIYRTFKKDRPP